jgi:DNA-directed RNA polymerase specialized sigma54-like protein
MGAQIDDDDPDRAWLLALLHEHLPALAKNRLPRVARRLGITLDELKLLLAKLRRLDPSPGPGLRRRRTPAAFARLAALRAHGAPPAAAGVGARLVAPAPAGGP